MRSGSWAMSGMRARVRTGVVEIEIQGLNEGLWERSGRRERVRREVSGRMAHAGSCRLRS